MRFGMMCSYCGGMGNEKVGPDGATWEIDRSSARKQGRDI
jgi:hypothetical protein